MTEEIPMTTNPESLLAVTQEDEDLCRDILEWVRDGHLAVIPGMLARHRATRPAPQITRGGGSNFYDRDGNLIRGERWIEVKGERWYQRPAPPAQPGREEVVEAAKRICDWLQVSETMSDRDNCLSQISGADEAMLLVSDIRAVAEAALAAEPLLARQDCPSCHGLNATCPDGCGRDPETGELNGTRLTRQDVRPEAEPVAWMYSKDGQTFVDADYNSARCQWARSLNWTETALYPEPPTLPTEPASVREERLRERDQKLIDAVREVCARVCDRHIDIKLCHELVGEDGKGAAFWMASHLAEDVRNAILTDHPRVIAALSTLPTEPSSVREENAAYLRDALKSAEAWLDRWAVHVGSCLGGNTCTCGLTAIRHEARAALSTEEPKL